MSYQVTRTKIVLPRRRSDLLSRPRLVTLLEDLLDFRLVILIAPAGYGKTFLLVDFAHHLQWPVCWYALDALDRDAYRFCSHFGLSARAFPPFFLGSCRRRHGSCRRRHGALEANSER